ncbi:hypothetical protein Drorol1_Dr00008830 [Drosera rotundifolia]
MRNRLVMKMTRWPLIRCCSSPNQKWRRWFPIKIPLLRSPISFQSMLPATMSALSPNKIPLNLVLFSVPFLPALILIGHLCDSFSLPKNMRDQDLLSFLGSAAFFPLSLQVLLFSSAWAATLTWVEGQLGPGVGLVDGEASRPTLFKTWAAQFQFVDITSQDSLLLLQRCSISDMLCSKSSLNSNMKVVRLNLNFSNPPESSQSDVGCKIYGQNMNKCPKDP